MDQCAPGTTVPIVEWMNRLELRVHERRLYDRGEAVVVDGLAEIIEQRAYLLRRGRHEVGAARIVVVAADPVLPRPDLPGYGAVLGACYGLTARGRSRAVLARGGGFGLATWLFGSWLVMPLIRVKQAPWRKGASENAVDVIAHVAYGLATALVAEELGEQSNRGPSSDIYRRAVKVG